MVPHYIRKFFYLSMGIPMRVNGILYRYFRAPKKGLIRVHLGPGQKNYIQNWINIDANFLTAKIDVWADLRNPLPFRDNTVDAFYSHHVIEHLPDHFLPLHFKDMYRCLKPGGIIRIGGPNGDTAINKFLEGDKTWFGDWPDKRRSIGGLFANFIFCRGEHFTILTYSYLEELLEDAGFSNIVQCLPTKETKHPDLIDHNVLDSEEELTIEVPHTLIIEAKKPKK